MYDDQLRPEDSLIDRGTEDILDEGYSPPEQPYGRGVLSDRRKASMSGLRERRARNPLSRIGNPLDTDEQQRSDEAEREIEFPQRREVGRVRAGRLIAPDRGFGEDTEAELVAEDVGISGGAASAEEAAIHIIDNGD